MSTGNLRTLRNQSGTNGSRTLGSILASDSGLSAGSFKRMYYWAKHNDPALFEKYSTIVSNAYRAQMQFL